MNKIRGCVIALTLLLAAQLANAQSLDFTLFPGFYPDPYTVRFTSGGPVDAFDMRDVYGYRCYGWIASQPDHVMWLTSAFSYLRIFAESVGDVTLLLYNPATGETFCDDDSHSWPQPELEMSYITAGEWWIYVGSYQRGTNHPYTLHVTEFTTDFAYYR